MELFAARGFIMRRRLQSSLEFTSDLAKRHLPTSLPLFAGMRQALAAGYDARSLRADLAAGLAVGIVALPLSMALAIAVGVEPQHGLYTAVVAGIVVALAGGSRYQISGPTATFIATLAPVATRYGLDGLLTTGLMAGLLLIVMGFAGFGRLIQYIPYPVTTGFTAGIAWIIATLQIKDVFGLPIAKQPEGYVEKLEAYWAARHDLRPAELGVAAVTFALLLIVPKITKRLPAPLVAIALVAGGCAILHALLPAFDVDTIGTRFRTQVGDTLYSGIPPLPPLPRLPWGEVHLSYAYLRALAPAAFAVAMLGAIETLLSAVIADGLTGSKHESNGELIGLGLGNVVAACFGGIAASGALARTATNIRSGAKSPLSAVAHGLAILVSILVMAKLVGYIPMAALAALLVLVAWNMSEARHAVRMLRVSPRSDATVLITCLFLTVFSDMVVAVGVGVVLAALLFMRRMAEITQTREVISRGGEGDGEIPELPKGVTLYEIAGALFFGAARNAISSLGVVSRDVRVLVLDLGRVPMIDVTGLVAIESIASELARRQIRVVIAGPLPQPKKVWAGAQLEGAKVLPSRKAALEEAARIAEELQAEGASKRSSVFPPRSTPAPPRSTKAPPKSTPAPPVSR